jgi:hypothetical protein
VAEIVKVTVALNSLDWNAGSFVRSQSSEAEFPSAFDAVSPSKLATGVATSGEAACLPLQAKPEAATLQVYVRGSVLVS